VSEVCDGPVCITCSDQAEQHVVVWVEGDTAGVRADGRAVEPVDVSLVDPVHPGDEVLVHAGVAIARLDGHGEEPT
jgi:hydrogenase maturation factor